MSYLCVRLHYRYVYQPYLFLCLSEGRGFESRSQRDQESLLREQGGAEGDVREGQAQGAGDHALVQPHRRDLPLQVVGQPAEPQAVHGSQQHPPHVTANQDRAQLSVISNRRLV